MPSKEALERKQKAVADLVDRMKASVSGVIVNYQGITVDTDTAMRKALREAGVRYTVVKNTLTERACKACGYDELAGYLSGMTAIAVSETDPVAPARILKEYDGKVGSFQILAGYAEGRILDAEGVRTLADIPSRETLLARFMGSVQSPLRRFAYAVKAVADQAEAASGGTAAEAAEPAAV